MALKVIEILKESIKREEHNSVSSSSGMVQAQQFNPDKGFFLLVLDRRYIDRCIKYKRGWNVEKGQRIPIWRFVDVITRIKGLNGCRFRLMVTSNDPIPDTDCRFLFLIQGIMSFTEITVEVLESGTLELYGIVLKDTLRTHIIGLQVVHNVNYNLKGTYVGGLVKLERR